MRDIRSLFMVRTFLLECPHPFISQYAPPQDGGIELALRATVQEFVQLVQNLAVRVRAGRRLTHALDSQVQLK